jgi:hypothetical protein
MSSRYANCGWMKKPLKWYQKMQWDDVIKLDSTTFSSTLSSYTSLETLEQDKQVLVLKVSKMGFSQCFCRQLRMKYTSQMPTSSMHVKSQNP